MTARFEDLAADEGLVTVERWEPAWREWAAMLSTRPRGLDGRTSGRLRVDLGPGGRGPRPEDAGAVVVARDWFGEAVAFEDVVAMRWGPEGRFLAPVAWTPAGMTPTTMAALLGPTGDPWVPGPPEGDPWTSTAGTEEEAMDLLLAVAECGPGVRVPGEVELWWTGGARPMPASARPTAAGREQPHPRTDLFAAVAAHFAPVGDGRAPWGSQSNRTGGWKPSRRRSCVEARPRREHSRVLDAVDGWAGRRSRLRAWAAAHAPHLPPPG